MDNKYRATASIVLGDKMYTLSFNWDQRAAFKSQFPDDAAISETLRDAANNPEMLSALVACCLSAHHPEITADFVQKNSPPIIPLSRALESVILYSLWGPDGPPSESPDEQQQPAEPSKKKTK